MKRGIQNIGRHALALNLSREHLRLVILGKRPDATGILVRYHELVEQEKELAKGPGVKFWAGDKFDLTPTVSPDQERELQKYCRRERGIFICQRPFALTFELVAESPSPATPDPKSTQKKPAKRGEIRHTKLLKGGLAVLNEIEEASRHLLNGYLEITDKVASGELSPAAAKEARQKLDSIEQALRGATRSDQPESQPDKATMDTLRAFNAAAREAASPQASKAAPVAR